MSDYLKYWRVIRYWVKAKYNIGTPELELLLFLYSEQMFTKSRFQEFETIMSKSLVRTVYRKLNGEEVGESPNINPLFRLDASYMDKMQRKMIKEMNEFIKQQRHLSPE